MARKKFYIGSDNWWRLRRLQLSGLGDFLCNWWENITIKYTIELKELKRIFAFVHHRYLAANIIEPQPQNMWITKFHLLPKTKIFTAYRKDDPECNQPICTATIVFDTPEFGLPSDNIYHDKLEEFRKQGKKLVEFCSLAALPNMQARNAYFPIFKILYKYTRFCGFTDIIISIQPKHAEFYKKILLFKCFEVRRYPRFRNVRAQMAHLDLRKAKENYKKIYEKFPKEFNLFQFFTSDLEINLDFEKIYYEIINDIDFERLFRNYKIWQQLSEKEKNFILNTRRDYKKRGPKCLGPPNNFFC